MQLDEKWAFVGKKEAHCDPEASADRELGDRWDHTAIDPEHALLLALVPGKRTEASARAVLEEVHTRTGGRTDLFLTSDEHAPYAAAIRSVYGIAGGAKSRTRALPVDLCYATVQKTRKKGRVVRVVRSIIFGTLLLLAICLGRSLVSSAINTSFVERHNGTDRHQNARKARKTYCFSKALDVHDAVSFFVAYSYNFCWPVRSLRERACGALPATPAIAAGLTDHIWPTAEWVTYPAWRAT